MKNTGNIYPPQLLKSVLSPNPNNSEIKTNYSNFVKNKQPTIFKHRRTKYSFDQMVIPTGGNNGNSNNNKIYNNNSKKIKGFDRVLSQKEIKDKIISEIKILNEKNDNLTDYELYKIGDKYLYFTNTSTENPLITKFKTFEGKLCHGRGYYHTDYPQFILDKNFEIYGCRYEIQNTLYDESIEKLDVMTKYELFKDNDISMHSRYNDTCEYPYFSLNADIFLYPKRYIGFSKQCLKENDLDIDDKIFKPENINIINESLLKNRTQHSILIWISIAAIDFYLMTCFFIDIDEENTFLNFYIWSAITLPFYLAMNIVAIIGLAAISKVKKYPLCNDEMTNLKIELFNNKSRKMLLNTLGLFIIINGQLVLTIVLYLLKRRKILRNTNNIDDAHSSNMMERVSKLSQDSPIMTERSNKSEL
jgi:hypothetical protein